jgi:hypothetical protein
VEGSLAAATPQIPTTSAAMVEGMANEVEVKLSGVGAKLQDEEGWSGCTKYVPWKNVVHD